MVEKNYRQLKTAVILGEKGECLNYPDMNNTKYPYLQSNNFEYKNNQIPNFTNFEEKNQKPPNTADIIEANQKSMRTNDIEEQKDEC